MIQIKARIGRSRYNDGVNSVSLAARPPSFLSLVAAGEPFRLLFPLGTLLGLVGVLLWPAWFYGGLEAWPVVPHARIMIQGFLGSFVVGFLGTALPRMLEVPKIGLIVSGTLAAGLLLLSGLHLAGQVIAGDVVFLLLLGGYLGLLVGRFRHRRDTPPPGFVLVALGMACGLAGTLLLILTALPETGLHPAAHTLGRLLLYQGFLLLPIMGIGAFLLPRFFGLPNRHDFPESLRLPPGWLRRAGFAGACGAVVLVSFGFEAAGWFRTGYGLRAAAVLAYFFREVPVHQARFSRGSLAFALRLALFSIPLGYAAMAFAPVWQGALIHIVFVTGFSLLTFTVASRVILGHSGQSELFVRRLVPVLALTVLLTAAMLTRVTADWMQDLRLSHYAYAALAWAAGVVVWAVAILPSVRRPDEA